MEIGITTDIIDSTRYPKGVFHYIKHLVQNIAKIQSDHNFHLIHYCQNQDIIYRLGFDEMLLKPYSMPFPTLSKLLTNIIKSPALLKNLDIIHIPEFRLPWSPLFFRSSAKKVLTLHGGHLWVPPASKPNIYRKPEAWMLTKFLELAFPKMKDKIDMYISVSHFLKKEMVKNLRIPEEKVRVIHLAADEKFKPQKVQGYTDFILSDTPIPELIKIFYKLKKRGVKHKLKIFSIREYGYKKAKEMAVNMGLQKDICFLGYVSDEELVKLYNTADLYLRLPLVETFGIPPLEAMACGCPVVTTNVGSLPEVVGDAGILKNPDDIEGLANAVYEVLTNGGLREEMIKKGFERAKKFSWEKTARETIKVYDEVCDANL